MAIVLSYLNRNEEGLKHAKQALDIGRYNYEPDHKQLKIYEDHIRRINEKLSDNWKFIVCTLQKHIWLIKQPKKTTMSIVQTHTKLYKAKKRDSFYWL